mgnify:CR=1 FL=1
MRLSSLCHINNKWIIIIINNVIAFVYSYFCNCYSNGQAWVAWENRIGNLIASLIVATSVHVSPSLVSGNHYKLILMVYKRYRKSQELRERGRRRKTETQTNLNDLRQRTSCGLWRIERISSQRVKTCLWWIYQREQVNCGRLKSPWSKRRWVRDSV